MLQKEIYQLFAWRFAFAVAFSLVLIVTATADESTDRAFGLALAETNCASCHAIGVRGESPHKMAPPFYTLSQRMPVETIDEALLLKLSPEHSDMPKFEISITQARQLKTYIAWVQPVEQGRLLVNDYCADCHAVGLDDESGHKEAPPFRNLSAFYPVSALEEAFAEGIDSGHPDMPVFEVDLPDLQNILAYIETLQKPATE